MKDLIVRTEGLKKYYRLGENTVKALDGVDFTVREREFAAIIGRSGSGKSTLLHMIGGLDTPTAGEVYVDGKRLSGMNRNQLAVFRRRKVGFIFQNYNLVPDLNVYDNVVLPVELDGRHIDREFVQEILELLKLEDRTDAFPGCFREDSSREWPSPAPWPQNPVLFWPMSPPAIWTLLRAMT